MKATPTPPGGPVPPAKSMSHAAPRPKACKSCLQGMLTVPIASLAYVAACVTKVSHYSQKSKWYQKLGQSFNAPGITQFGKLTLVRHSDFIHQCLAWLQVLCLHLQRIAPLQWLPLQSYAQELLGNSGFLIAIKPQALSPAFFTQLSYCQALSLPTKLALLHSAA